MPGHYKKKLKMSSVSKKAKKMKKQKGGQMKKKVHCVCSRNHHPMGNMQKGGRVLSPAMMKLLQRQHPDFRTLPVLRQRGMGHCGCQRGGDFLGIGKAFKRFTKNPLRIGAAILTAGASEVIALPADILKHNTGIKASDVLTVGAPVLTAINPAGALGTKLTAFGLKQAGLGRRRKK